MFSPIRFGLRCNRIAVSSIPLPNPRSRSCLAYLSTESGNLSLPDSKLELDDLEKYPFFPFRSAPAASDPQNLDSENEKSNTNDIAVPSDPMKYDIFALTVSVPPSYRSPESQYWSKRLHDLDSGSLLKFRSNEHAKGDNKSDLAQISSLRRACYAYTDELRSRLPQIDQYCKKARSDKNSTPELYHAISSCISHILNFQIHSFAQFSSSSRVFPSESELTALSPSVFMNLPIIPSALGVFDIPRSLSHFTPFIFSFTQFGSIFSILNSIPPEYLSLSCLRLLTQSIQLHSVCPPNWSTLTTETWQTFFLNGTYYNTMQKYYAGIIRANQNALGPLSSASAIEECARCIESASNSAWDLWSMQHYYGPRYLLSKSYPDYYSRSLLESKFASEFPRPFSVPSSISRTLIPDSISCNSILSVLQRKIYFATEELPDYQPTDFNSISASIVSYSNIPEVSRFLAVAHDRRLMDNSKNAVLRLPITSSPFRAFAKSPSAVEKPDRSLFTAGITDFLLRTLPSSIENQIASISPSQLSNFVPILNQTDHFLLPFELYFADLSGRPSPKSGIETIDVPFYILLMEFLSATGSSLNLFFVLFYCLRVERFHLVGDSSRSSSSKLDPRFYWFRLLLKTFERHLDDNSFLLKMLDTDPTLLSSYSNLNLPYLTQERALIRSSFDFTTHVLELGNLLESDQQVKRLIKILHRKLERN